MNSTNGNEVKKKGTAGDMIKGVTILVLLVVGAGAGGYFFGTMQKFAPIQNVPPGTAGATTLTSNATAGNLPGAVGTLKNKYWIHTSGDNHVGYAVSVAVNGQTVGQFSTPNRDEDITRFVKEGKNDVTFVAEPLPDGMNEHKGQSNYYLVVSIASGDQIVNDPPEKNILLNYRRTAADTEKFTDPLSFMTVE